MIHCSAVRLNNSDLRQRVTEVRIACPRSLARVDDLAAGIADVVDAAVLADSVPAGVIAEANRFRVAGSIGAGHLLQLAAVLPTVAPCAVVGQVTDGIGGQCLPVVAGEQILPRAITVTIGDGIQRRTQRAGGIGEIFLCEEAVEENRIPPTVSSFKGKNASPNFKYSQNIYILQVICYVPASIAVMIPWYLTGMFFPFRFLHLSWFLLNCHINFIRTNKLIRCPPPNF